MERLDGQIVRSDGSISGDRLCGMDFESHNRDAREAWQSLRNPNQRPTRVPIFFGTNTRYFMFNDAANPRRVSFREYTEDPDLMFDLALRFQRWSRFNLIQDFDLGLPEKWVIAPDFQNYHEAAWLGCPIHFMDGQVPDTTPAFGDAPQRVTENGLPDPFGGILARGRAYFEHFRARAAKETFLGRPIEISTPTFGIGTDGPMTVACNVFGPEFVCTAMVEEPQRLHHLLAFITEATIARMLAWRRYARMKIPPDEFGFADDSIALISTAMYRQHVLPHHRRLCEVMAPGGAFHIHLCGDATRHFRIIRDELSVRSFDTGFPIDFGGVRRALGPQVIILGGPNIELLLTSTPLGVTQDVRRIFASGVADGGRFALREGNNLAPYTPLENCEAMYRAGRELGQFHVERAAAAAGEFSCN